MKRQAGRYGRLIGSLILLGLVLVAWSYLHPRLYPQRLLDTTRALDIDPGALFYSESEHALEAYLYLKHAK